MDEPNTPSNPGEGAGDLAHGAGMAMLTRAMGGDEEAQGKLIGLLGDREVGGKIADFFGDMRAYADDTIIGEAAGANLLVRKAIRKKMKAIAAELAGPAPSPIERLLAERASFCWLVVYRYEHILANAKDLTSKREEFHHRRIDAAHRRYLSSLRTLAQVRKLAVPALQVNIGRNQVNVTES